MYDDLVKRLRAQADAERYFVGEDMLYDKAADAIEELTRENKELSFRSAQLEAMNDALIGETGAADVRPVVSGKWIDRDDDYYGWNMWSCSACGEEFVLTEGTPDMNDYHFCPNCGADMRPEPPKEE